MRNLESDTSHLTPEGPRTQGPRRPFNRQDNELSPPIEPESPLPDEQASFFANAKHWKKLLPEQQRAIADLASERIRVETEQAYDQSNLNLNDDQREVFALRYRQERRRLERELQEKANAERTHRLPQIIEQLRREFSRSSIPTLLNGRDAGIKPSPTPIPSSTPSPATGGDGGNVSPRPLSQV